MSWLNQSLESRRQFLVAGCGILLGNACASTPRGVLTAPGTSDAPRVDANEPPPQLVELEAELGGRIGVLARDLETGRELAHRADELFKMCSTFKWVLAAAILARVDRKELSLGELVPYSAEDVLEHAPAAREHLSDGAMTIEALAHASVVVSDNTAANLLLGKIGGPAGLTQFIRLHGDDVTRLDRLEPAMNEGPEHDPRDTTSPRAMAGLLRRLLLEDALPVPHRERLLGWMRETDTGKRRLRAGLPQHWVAGDKTGTGPENRVNDVAIAMPPGRKPIVIVVYMSGSNASFDLLQQAHAEIGRLVGEELGA
jgi:beta-lactamase class A